MIDRPATQGRWIMFQRWHDLLFAHWPIEPRVMRALVPEPLELDLFDGSVWIAVVPFRMSAIRLRGFPALPGTSAFEELNLRTYVRAGGRRGVYFFSLDAKNRLAVEVARRWFRLPYFHARMQLEHIGDGLRYAAERIHAHAPPAVLRMDYTPAGEVFHCKPGSLAEFLTERYCLFTCDERGVMRGDIEHEPWPLQRATARFEENTLARASGIELPETQPHLLFARRLDVRIWAPRRVE